jgi:processive 1,2-diacylglycerol beta-glucosyltransferase
VAAPILARGLARFESLLLTARPAAVVCTHAWPAVLAARLVRTERLLTKVVCVSTDFGAHALWPIRGTALFCAADDASAEQAAERDTTAEIAVTGIPVRVQFTVEYDRSTTREHFGLPSEKRLLLAIAGASAPGPYRHLKPALEVALPSLASLPDTAVAVVTGRDNAYADALKARASGFGTTNVSVLGFVEHMAPLMSCADIGIAKPGGLVCAECLSAGLPLVTVGPTAGQERVNAKALASAGASLHAENPRLLAEYVRKVASKPPRLARMREAASTLSRPFAAADIARRTLSLVGVDVAEDE